MTSLPQPVSAWPSLEAIAEDVRVCPRCRLSQSRTLAVPGEGAPAAQFMFIGEGPGFNEDRQGRPFVGRAGKLLDEMLASVPLRREDVFITNIVKCRPPENRDPLPDEVAACSPYLESQIALIRPRVIVTLGRHSLYRFFPEAKISRDHGRIMRWREIVVCPMYHPAAALRADAVMQAFAADFKRLPEALVESLRAGGQAKPAAEEEPTLLYPPVRTPPETKSGAAARPAPPVGRTSEDGKQEQRQMGMF